MDKVVFIIAHKYYSGYVSYLKYYIDNILEFYENPLILVVDNNSTFKERVFSEIDVRDNIIFLDNNIESKFEIGAYNVGINYLIENKLLDEFKYVFCTQDNYIIKKKYDINILNENNIKACSIIGLSNDFAKKDVAAQILSNIGLLNKFESSLLCWCNSFVLSTDKVLQFYDYIKEIIITNRYQSEASERYLGTILLELNNNINSTIDGSDNTFFINGVGYDCHNINPYGDIDKYFCKISQQKNEQTINR